MKAWLLSERQCVRAPASCLYPRCGAGHVMRSLKWSRLRCHVDVTPHVIDWKGTKILLVGTKSKLRNCGSFKLTIADSVIFLSSQVKSLSVILYS